MFPSSLHADLAMLVFAISFFFIEHP